MRLVFSDNPSFADLGWFGLLLLAVLFRGLSSSTRADMATSLVVPP